MRTETGSEAEAAIEAEIETEVVIAGAGPTGLTLAHELALAGIGTVVLEALSERIEQVKGGAIQPRTAELLQTRGLLEPLLRRATPREAVGGHFAMLPVPLDCTPWRTRHPYPVSVPQWIIEEVLEQRALALGARVLRGTPVTAVTDLAPDLTADDAQPDGARQGPTTMPGAPQHTARSGGPAGSGAAGAAGAAERSTGGVCVTAGGLRVRARYLVACDGGRSTVRKLLGMPFPGRSGTFLAVLADVRLSAVSSLVPRVAGHISTMTRRTGDHWAMLIPIGGDRYRLTYGHARQDGVTRETPVTDDEIATALRAVYGDETVLAGVLNASRFTDATRQVERYRAGHVLFAGDAAHIHPPFGGQGLNLGVQDALNLGWKLAAEVRGRAPLGLLDSYHTERHPVAAGVLHHTSAQRLLAASEPSSDVLAMRDIVTDLLRLPDANRYVAGLMSGLALRYDLPGDHPLTGCRVPDADLATPDGPGRLSALAAGGHAVLLDLAGIVPADLPLPAGVDLVRAKAQEGPEAGALLLRPDGYVCWAADDAETCRRTLLPAIRAHLTTA